MVSAVASAAVAPAGRASSTAASSLGRVTTLPDSRCPETVRELVRAAAICAGPGSAAGASAAPGLDSGHDPGRLSLTGLFVTCRGCQA